MPLLAAAMLPWTVFWAQHQALMTDGAKLQVAVSARCENAVPRYTVIVARGEKARAKGLGGRRAPLANNEGMLFVFDPPVQVSFWMKETYIPLQIVFFDSEGRLTRQYFMRTEFDPENPVKTYDAPGPSNVALELAPASIPQEAIGKNRLCISAQ